MAAHDMIPFDEAYRIALNAARTLPVEAIPFREAQGRILAQDVRADMDMPPFDKAMVDGYACRRNDLGGALRVVETVAAGHAPTRGIGPGECAKIMTGAMMPEGADCVFMVEQSEVSADDVHFIGEKTNDNIAPRAKDIREGDVLLGPGHKLAAPDIAVLAAVGCVEPSVYRRARVAVVATGDELIEPEGAPGIAQIRNSNAYQLCAQLERVGCEASYNGIAEDTEASLESCIERGLDGHDVVLFSGGVSMGEFDLVPGILEVRGIAIQFDRIAIQPGKPTTFALSDEVYCFGLPGNPVSTFVIFELLVRPFLLALMGCTQRPPTLRMPLAEAFVRKSGAREAWVPVATTEDGRLRRVAYHGSAHINALCEAEGLIAFPQGVTELEEGRIVEVRLIRD